MRMHKNHYREAIKSNPKIVRAYFHLAVLYANENKYNEARTIARHA